jgi:hypothetical protein
MQRNPGEVIAVTIAETTYFGVELETTLRASDDTNIGVYHHGNPVPYLPIGWKVERDGSIRCVNGRRAAEFVSPKLIGRDGIMQVVQAVEIIKARGAQVNDSCGVHVTVSWNGDAKALARLVCLVANYEKALFATTGTKRRERGHYCRPVKRYGNAGAAQSQCRGDRYHMLNLTHLARGSNRIEFRLFAGSLNATKIVGHILTVLALVDLACTSSRAVGWDYKCESGTPAWARSGEGHTEVTRMFYRFGWIKGHTPRVVAGELVSTELLVAIKKKFVEMAKKYDAAEQARTGVA